MYVLGATVCRTVSYSVGLIWTLHPLAFLHATPDATHGARESGVAGPDDTQTISQPVRTSAPRAARSP